MKQSSPQTIVKRVILIPTYNERENIARIVHEIFILQPELFVTVIDDSSPDGTAAVVQGMTQRYPHLTLLSRPGKQGLGEAYKAGIAYTLQDPTVTRIILMDADGSHAAEYLGALLADPADVVIGSRYIRGGGIEQWERWRFALSNYGNLYARFITHLPIHDMTAGFASYNAELLRHIDFRLFHSSGYAFQMELKHYMVCILGGSVAEVPIIFRARREGESKISHHIIKEGLKTPWRLLMKHGDRRIGCRLCGNPARFYTRKEGCDVWHCSTCGFIFVSPLPEVVALYSKNYFTGAAGGHGYTSYDTDKEPMVPAFRSYLRRAGRLVAMRGSLLDVGAATGFFVALAREDGYDAEGIELSAYAAAEGRKKGLAIATGTLADVPSKKRFQVITMLDVIEHVPDPRAELALAHAHLEEGGLLLINTPDTGSLFARILGKHWHLIVPPEHLSYFNRKNLSALLGELGFEVVLVTAIGKRFTLPYIFTTLHRWQGFSFWQTLARWSKGNRMRSIAVPINLGDNLFLIARAKQL